MEGFQDGAPVLAKVTWATNEVALLNGKPTTYGLLAEVPNTATGGVTRYFVPWSAVSYLKQDIAADSLNHQSQVVITTSQPDPTPH